MMKPYPKYKDSGVEWIGAVPAGWEVMKLKWLAQINLSNVDKKSKEDEQTVKLCNYVDVYYNEKITPEINFMIATARKDQINTLSLEKGDILITKDSEDPYDIAVPAFVPETLPGVVCGYHLAHIRPNKNIADGNYLARAFVSDGISNQFEVAANGITRFGISKDTVLNSIFPLPPLPEQTAIAAYLDEKTAQIDTLIERKRRLIDLLQEERTALISRAVTKGLAGLPPKGQPPDWSQPDWSSFENCSNLRDSGVEWLGEIPVGWEVAKLKYVVNGIIDTEHKTAPFYENGDYFVCRTSNIKDGKITMVDAKFTDRAGYEEWTRRGKPKSGDIIFTREAPAGEAAIVPESPVLCLGQRTVLFKVIPQILDAQFGVYSIYGGVASQYITVLSQGSTVSHLNMSDINNIPLLLPPLEEQRAIAAYLDEKTAHIDRLISRTERQIELLREYRTALISAAVTGKIDVRGESGGD